VTKKVGMLDFWFDRLKDFFQLVDMKPTDPPKVLQPAPREQ
jgi:hypothetical protein